MTLGAAVRMVMSMPASLEGTIQQTTLFREVGHKQAICDFPEIERLATVLDEGCKSAGRRHLIS